MNSDLECENLLSCLYGFNQTDIRVFETISETDEPASIDEITEIVERDRGHIFRCIKKLQSHGFVQRDQINNDSGGYYHVYYLRDPDSKSSEMQKELNDMYSEIQSLIETFSRKYDTVS